MLRTPPMIRQLLEESGYIWNPDVDGWHRRGEKVGFLSGRVLDADIACTLTHEQVSAWIKDGET